MAADANLLAEAVEQYRAGRFGEARVAFEKLVAIEPRDAALWQRLAATLLRLGDLAGAEKAAAEAVRLDPRSAAALCTLAEVRFALRDFEQVEDCSRRALKVEPGSAAAHNLLGAALFKSGKLDEALDIGRRAARLPGGQAVAHANLGVILTALDRLPEAVAAFQQSLTLDAANAETHYNLGNALRKQARFDEALASYDRAISLMRAHADAHVNRASVLLARGDYGAGWAEYEWRFRGRDFPRFEPPCPVWNSEPLAGRTIVLVAEQGLGDTLQFIRYAPLIQSRGARVLVLATRLLHPILARTPGVDGWLAPGETIDADFCLPLMSAPHRLATTVDTIPADVPYLFADPARVAAWRERLAKIEGLRVGIVWRGERGHPEDRLRSIPPEVLAPLAAISGVRLVCLQKGAERDELAAIAPPGAVVDFGEDLDRAGGAFMDTAAIIMNLDLVIACDTAVAHLAGGLGARTWLALAQVPDWRWLLERGDTPWYPTTLRLFRQQQRGDWAGVVASMRRELETR